MSPTVGHSYDEYQAAIDEQLIGGLEGTVPLTKKGWNGIPSLLYQCSGGRRDVWNTRSTSTVSPRTRYGTM